MTQKTVVLSNQRIHSVKNLVNELEQIENGTEITLTNFNPPLLPSTAFKLGYAFCLGKKIVCSQSILKIILGYSNSQI